MATPLVSGTVALLFNEYGNLTPLQVKTMLMNSCTDLKDTAAHQGAGMLNLRMLFSAEKDNSYRNSQDSKYRESGKSQDTTIKAANKTSNSEFYENAIMILVVLLLLDSRI